MMPAIPCASPASESKTAAETPEDLNGSNTILMSHSPSAVSDLYRQMQDAVLIGQKMANPGP
jgi:hypothetical protein